MDTKAAFEKFREWWFAEEQDELRLNLAEGWGFRVWLASRAAIEIELPELQVIPEEESDIPDFSDWPMGFNEGVKSSIKAITSHGIRIKGKTE